MGITCPQDQIVEAVRRRCPQGLTEAAFERDLLGLYGDLRRPTGASTASTARGWCRLIVAGLCRGRAWSVSGRAGPRPACRPEIVLEKCQLSSIGGLMSAELVRVSTTVPQETRPQADNGRGVDRPVGPRPESGDDPRLPVGRRQVPSIREQTAEGNHAGRPPSLRRLARPARPGVQAPLPVGREEPVRVRPPPGLPAVRRGPAAAAPCPPRPSGRADTDRGGGPGLLAAEHNPRDHALLCLLYATAVRVSECCNLKWRDVQERAEGGQITVLGKGGKTNTILVPASVWARLVVLRGRRVSMGRSSGAARASTCTRHMCGGSCAGRHGGPGSTSRSAPTGCATLTARHALDRGAPIHLVQATCAHASVATTGRYLHARPNESSSTFLPL